MPVQNYKVVEAWKNGNQARSFTGNLHTDGKDLYSYALKIGFTTAKGRKAGKTVILYTSADGAFKSMTTSRHVGYARSVAKHQQLAE